MPKSHEILTEIFFSHIDWKQQQNDQKLCGEGLGAKPSHLGLLVFVLKVMKFWPKHFLVVLMGNNKKWTEKNVGMFHV